MTAITPPVDKFVNKHNPLIIAGPVGDLEAVVLPPARELAKIVVIICHPHPLYGGTMDNKVVTTAGRAIYDLGIWHIRFNFRGIGASEGKYDQGHGEVQDLAAVIAWTKQQFPEYSIWLAGFSFGAYIAMQGAVIDPSIQQLITIAPAVNHFDFQESALVKCPWLLLMGEADELVPFDQVKQWVGELKRPITTIYFPDVGHFFHGHLVDLREQLKAALSRRIELPS